MALRDDDDDDDNILRRDHQRYMEITPLAHNIKLTLFIVGFPRAMRADRLPYYSYAR